MSFLLGIAIIALFAAQFTRRGKAFLATDGGSTLTVAIAAGVIIGMLPGLFLGAVLNLVFMGMWAWVAYPRLPAAKRYLRGVLRLPR